MDVDAVVCELSLQGSNGFGQAQGEWREGTPYKGREREMHGGR